MSRRSTTTQLSPAARAAKHLSDFASGTSSDEFWISQVIDYRGSERAAVIRDRQDSHIVEHLANDARLRETVGASDARGLDIWVQSLGDERLNEVHAAAHNDTCAVCEEPVMARHTDSSLYPYWFHTATGDVACAAVAHGEARPSRFGVVYATVTRTFRVRLPRALGPDPSPEDIESYFDDTYVAHDMDDQSEDPEMASDPIRFLDEVTIVTDIGSSPTV